MGGVQGSGGTGHRPGGAVGRGGPSPLPEWSSSALSQSESSETWGGENVKVGVVLNILRASPCPTAGSGGFGDPPPLLEGRVLRTHPPLW